MTRVILTRCPTCRGRGTNGNGRTCENCNGIGELQTGDVSHDSRAVALQQQIDKAYEVRGKAQAVRDEAKRVRDELADPKSIPSAANGLQRHSRNGH